MTAPSSTGNIISYGAFTVMNRLGIQKVAGVNLGDYVYYDVGAKVAEGIFIGSLSTATSDFALQQNQIGAIINLSGADYETSLPAYKIIMDDVDVTPETVDSYVRRFSRGVRAIALARGAGLNVLVHCAAGVNRSATLIGFYLLSVGWRYDDAITALECANASRQVPLLTNESFRYLLRVYDAINCHLK